MKTTLWTLGLMPYTFGALVAIGHSLGVGWEIAAIPFVACLGIWGGLMSARVK